MPDSPLSSFRQQIITPSSSPVKNMFFKTGGHGFLPPLRVSGLNSIKDRVGPAFLGQVLSTCDLSGTGLMAVSTHLEVPFLPKGFIIKIVGKVTFFMKA